MPCDGKRHLRANAARVAAMVREACPGAVPCGGTRRAPSSALHAFRPATPCGAFPAFDPGAPNLMAPCDVLVRACGVGCALAFRVDLDEEDFLSLNWRPALATLTPMGGEAGTTGGGCEGGAGGRCSAHALPSLLGFHVHATMKAAVVMESMSRGSVCVRRDGGPREVDGAACPAKHNQEFGGWQVQEISIDAGGRTRTPRVPGPSRVRRLLGSTPVANANVLAATRLVAYRRFTSRGRGCFL